MRAVLPFWIRQHQSTAFAVLILATAATLLIPSFTRSQSVPPPVSAPRPIPQVMVAAHPIPSGTVLAIQDIIPRPAAGTVPAGAYQSGETMVGRVTARGFAAGDLLLAVDLRDAASLGIAAKLAKGQRAFSIRIAEDEIVGGFLQSGDFVDVVAVIPGTVFAARTAGEVPDRSTSILLLQNVQVLAVGENLASTGKAQTTARTVSLALNPDQASRLALAQRFGKVSLTTRRPGDETIIPAPAISLADIVPQGGRQGPTPKPSQQLRITRAPAGIPYYAGTQVTRAGWNRP